VTKSSKLLLITSQSNPTALQPYSLRTGTLMTELSQLLTDRLVSGLKRSAITKCSEWANRYRVMGSPYPGPWTFDHHPWLREMHDAEGELIIGQKGAQLGFTEYALNETFYAIDMKGQSVLYILPASTPDAKDFATSRFDPALEGSKHLRELFTDVKNIHHKRAGHANLFIRGSRSRSQLKSVPVAKIILDEVDEMVQRNIPLVFERVSGQIEKQIMMISTPTIENMGINEYYNRSTREHFFFKCPHCSKLTELTFPDCLVITSEDPDDADIMNTHIVCKECKHPLDHTTKPDWLKDGQWVAETPDKMSRGFHVNQLYSCTVEPYKLAILYLQSLTDQTKEQEFYNSKLGLPHAVKGARVTETEIKEAMREYMMGPVQGLITMGIDVGNTLHYEVCSWEIIPSQTADLNSSAKAKVICSGGVQHFEELDDLLRDYNVVTAVIDANPEKRKAFEFAQRNYGKVKLCYYGRNVRGKDISVSAKESHAISVDRTSWLDASLGRFRNKTITLPRDIAQEYKTHIMVPTRIYEKDADGNQVGRYVSGTKADHLAHARNYCEIALPLAAGAVANYDIQNY